MHFMHLGISFGFLKIFWGFSKLVECLWNFWDRLCENGSKSSCITSHLHYNNVSCIIDVCLLCWTDCVLVGLDWAKPMTFLLLHTTFSCIFMHTYLTFSIFLYIDCDWCFYACLFLPPPLFLSLLFMLVASWHLNENLLRPGTLFVSGHPLLLTLLPHTSGFVMRRPNRISLRASLDKAFIWNAKSFCRTSPTLTYSLSFTVGVGSHCVMSRSFVHPCWYRSSTSTCIDLIIMYLFLLLGFEVWVLWSLRILYSRCSTSWG